MQKRLAISLGVSEADIITLDTPKDTKEEAIESKKIVDGKKLILVTTASHMKRASMLFKKEGLDIIESPTNHKYFTSTYSQQASQILKALYHQQRSVKLQIQSGHFQSQPGSHHLDANTDQQAGQQNQQSRLCKQLDEKTASGRSRHSPDTEFTHTSKERPREQMKEIKQGHQ
jgi:hypothetical protein